MQLNLLGWRGVAAVGFIALAQACGAETVWLSSLDLSHVIQGWGRPGADKAVSGKPLLIKGQSFAHGIGTHADSLIRLDLGGTAEQFSARAGVDDGAGRSPAGIVFKVVGDGRILWKSGVTQLGEPAQPVQLDVRGIRTLLLEAVAEGGNISYAHADWADAKVVYSGRRPEVIGPPPEPAVILTPKPPLTPRINGARVFGVRPRHPFLFTIAATGERPMRFGVRNLPRGLKVDTASGQITGELDRPGTYVVMLQAANKAGKAQQRFKIVCGETLALTPHMGWNSWYVWENHVSDGIMRAAADAMVSSGLRDHGYEYINIDDCWAVKPGATDPELGGAPRDAQGQVNANRRFPDMKALTDYIHARGLKAGIYTSPGPLTCAGHVGAYQHEEQDARRFAEWGFDFLKYDWCSYGDIAKDPSLADLEKPYRVMAGCLRRQNRDLVLNLCQYGMGQVWKWGKGVGGNSWRTAGDLGGSFEGIPLALFRDGFDLYSREHLEQFGGPGGWNDPDYLLLGFLSNWRGQTAPTPLTPNEQYTQVSLWSLVAAPLILSGDITRLDDFTLSLLSNDEVIAVDQDSLGRPGRRVAQDETREVWARELEGHALAVGLFNRGEEPVTVTADWAALGLAGKQKLRDLWRQQDLGPFEHKFLAMVHRHGVVLVRLVPAH